MVPINEIPFYAKFVCKRYFTFGQHESVLNQCDLPVAGYPCRMSDNTYIAYRKKSYLKYQRNSSDRLSNAHACMMHLAAADSESTHYRSLFSDYHSTPGNSIPDGSDDLLSKAHVCLTDDRYFSVATGHHFALSPNQLFHGIAESALVLSLPDLSYLS